MGIQVITQDGRLKDRGGLVPLTGVVFRAGKNSAQAYISSSNRVVLSSYDVETFDPYNWFDTSTGRFTPLVAGYYAVSVGVASDLLTADNWLIGSIFKNGAVFTIGDTCYQRGAVAAPGSGIASHVYLNGSTDYIQAGAQCAQNTNLYVNNFSANLVGASTGFLPGSYPPGPQSGSPAASGYVPVADGAGSYAWKAHPKAIGSFKAHMSANYTPGGSSFQGPMPFNTVDYDVSGWYDTTNFRFMPQVAGYYRFYVVLEDNSSGGANLRQGFIRQSGARLGPVGAHNGTGNGSAISGSMAFLMNGSTDYADVSLFLGTVQTFYGGSLGNDGSSFSGDFIGTA